MKGLKELTGSTLRAAADAMARAPDDVEAAFEDATGLPTEALPCVRTALEVVGSRLMDVARVRIIPIDEMQGTGTLVGDLEYIVELAGPPAAPRGRAQQAPDLVRVVRKGEKAFGAPKQPDTKPRWPSSPPKHDLPIGRGLFSSAGKRESPRPGVAPVPMEKKTPAEPERGPIERRPVERPRKPPERGTRGPRRFDGKPPGSRGPGDAKGASKDRAMPRNQRPPHRDRSRPTPKR